ncbi:M20 family metallopeptidase [Microlunatus panaciterrae]|uniref:Amidohydrolase n=1 Tax=Microlunatus panaciterrae TaxID=400768 RepID=A0ABS2RL02_9ACTN|nr:amidohydrolase [Microlunatus panaciterrae]MBM7799694.1 amidohydrolase [Microlunatus panaciterrae]
MRMVSTQQGRAQSELRAAVAEEVDALTDELISIRRDLHAHPEVGYAEHRTTAKIVQLLRAVGLDPVVLPVGTGAYCDVLPAGVADSKGLIGLRADIDALPIDDGKDVAYASRNPGVCHACGHDVHTTVVLGVGLALVRLRDRGLLRHGVRLIFQPAEESTPGGALSAIDGGALQGVREVYALHCDPRTDVGHVGLKVGAVTSAADRVLIRLSGPGGHTSRPHLTADLVGALGVLATSLPLLLSRRVDPRSGASLIWGRIRSGSASNAIPQRGEIEGTLRSLDVSGWRAAEQLLPELATQLVAPFRVSIDVLVTPGVPPTVNHAEGVLRLTEAAEAVLGPTSVVPTEQSLGGEDFSWMLQKLPGAMARLGVRTPGAVEFADIHQPTFTVDERCIAVGAKLLLAVVTRAGVTPPPSP